MSQVVADRRILKAFYTQYVSVLLILLVFCVTAPHVTRSMPVPMKFSSTIPVHAAFGSMRMKNPFSVEGGTVIQHTGELDAIAEVAINHDVRVELHVPVFSESTLGSSKAFREGIQRAEAIRDYLVKRRVTRSAVSVIVEDGASAEDSLTVVFRSEGGHDEYS